MSSVGSTISNSLGLGYGIDSGSIVTSLVSAVRDPKQSAIDSRQSANNARISALASAKNQLSAFSDALTGLLNGTGYSGEPASNDTSIATVSLLPGGVPSGLPAQLVVNTLAAGQVLKSTSLGSSSDAVGLGTLNLTVGSGSPVTITVDSSNNSLSGLAKADRKSTRLNSSHTDISRMPSSA